MLAEIILKNAQTDNLEGYLRNYLEPGLANASITSSNRQYLEVERTQVIQELQLRQQTSIHYGTPTPTETERLTDEYRHYL